MKWLLIIPVVYVLWRCLKPKPKPTVVEDWKEPPQEFVSITRHNPNELVRARGVVK